MLSNNAYGLIIINLASRVIGRCGFSSSVLFPMDRQDSRVSSCAKIHPKIYLKLQQPDYKMTFFFCHCQRFLPENSEGTEAAGETVLQYKDGKS